MRRQTACLFAIALTCLVGACAQTDDGGGLPPSKIDGGVDTTPGVDTNVTETDPDAIIDTGTPGEVGPSCTPGDIDNQACGKCGKQIRTCGPASTWNPWKPCQDEIAGADCSIGEVNTIDCGNCGKQKDTCDPVACTWVTGSCSGEGPCAPGDKEKTTASCTVAGEVRERLCSDKCAWSAFSACKLPTGFVKIATPATTFGGRKWATGIWSGTDAYVWGGYYYATPYTYSKADGASYNIGSDSWTIMPAAPSAFTTAGRYLHSGVFDGKNFILFGGIESSSTVKNTGAMFDTSAKAWSTTVMSTTGAPTARAGHSAAWVTTTGGFKEMVIWGGCTSPSSYGTSCSAYAADGASWDPVKNTWTAIPAPPTVTGFVGRWKHKMVWTGSELIIWGGQSSSGYMKDGIRYDPIGKTWTTFSAPTWDGRMEGAGEWTGKELLAWGGYGSYLGSSYGRSDGGRYLPGGGWSTVTAPDSTALSSPARWAFQTWFAGGKLYVWSGFGGSGTITSGGATYDPTLDLWATLDDTDAPTTRAYATVIPTGKETIIYGGTNSTSYFGSVWYADGAIYRP
jgi:hypothetical protein